MVSICQTRSVPLTYIAWPLFISRNVTLTQRGCVWPGVASDGVQMTNEWDPLSPLWLLKGCWLKFSELCDTGNSDTTAPKSWSRMFVYPHHLSRLRFTRCHLSHPSTSSVVRHLQTHSLLLCAIRSCFWVLPKQPEWDGGSACSVSHGLCSCKIIKSRIVFNCHRACSVSSTWKESYRRTRSKQLNFSCCRPTWFHTKKQEIVWLKYFKYFHPFILYQLNEFWTVQTHSMQ